jgi:hypothetical protein
MKKIFLINLLLLATLHIHAQRQYTDNNLLWLSYSGAHKISGRIGIHLEGQVRRSEFGLKDQQYLFRTGINYHAASNCFFSAGYCFVQTYPYGAFGAKSAFPEHRTWEQFQFRTPVQKLEMITRLRLEQRWVYSPVLQNDGFYKPGKDVYTNRVRFMQRASLPLKGDFSAKAIYLSLFDEAFINFGKNVQLNVFDQNRAFFGVGYKFSKPMRLELGYLNQLIMKADGLRLESNHTILLSFISAIDWFKPVQN